MAKFVGVVESGRGLSKLRVLLAVSVAVACVASFSDPADAQYYRGGSRYYAPYYGFGGYYSAPRRTVTRHTTTSAPHAEPKKDIGFGEMPKGPLQIFVSINAQKVTLYSNGVRVAQGPASTGIPGHPTPIGVFSVIEKDRHHHSNIYSGAPMPFMQRITWSGVALHEGVVPGHPASHGCIRMTHDFAQKLWPITKLGVRVIVSRPELSPVDFEHAKLFVPRPKPDGSQVAAVEEPIRLAQVKMATEEGVTVMDVIPSPAPESSTPERAPNAAEAPAPATETRTETVAKPAEPPQSADAPASEKAAEATGAITPAQPAPADAPPAVELRKAVEAPQRTEAPKAAAPAAVETKPAEAVPASTEPVKPVPADIDPPKPIAPRIKNANQPQKRTGQVAVFVSRKEKKIFVRQGFVPLFDMPITIDEPEHPLGTHVFTAMGTTEDGAGMRWNLITVPNDVSRPEPQPSRRRGRYESPVVQAPASNRAPSSAAEALDRIHFPQEAVDRIADLLIPGSSLVVSDEGISRETGRGTDFIVLTR